MLLFVRGVKLVGFALPDERAGVDDLTGVDERLGDGDGDLRPLFEDPHATIFPEDIFTISK